MLPAQVQTATGWQNRTVARSQRILLLPAGKPVPVSGLLQNICLPSVYGMVCNLFIHIVILEEFLERQTSDTGYRIQRCQCECRYCQIDQVNTRVCGRPITSGSLQLLLRRSEAVWSDPVLLLHLCKDATAIRAMIASILSISMAPKDTGSMFFHF